MYLGFIRPSLLLFPRSSHVVHKHFANGCFCGHAVTVESHNLLPPFIQQVRFILINSTGCEQAFLQANIMLAKIYAATEVAVLIMRIYNLLPL